MNMNRTVGLVFFHRKTSVRNKERYTDEEKKRKEYVVVKFGGRYIYNTLSFLVPIAST